MGLAFMLEQHRVHFGRNYIHKKTGVSPAMLDCLELGAECTCWEPYRKVLELYQKDIKIELVDRSPEETSWEKICNH